MTETETQPLPPMMSPRAIAEAIASNAQELDGVDVVSVSPMFVDVLDDRDNPPPSTIGLLSPHRKWARVARR